MGNHPLISGLTGSLLAVAMAGLTLLALGAGRSDALYHARQTSQNLVSIISSDLARNVEIYDLSLQSIVDGARDPAAVHLPFSVRREILFDRATTAAYLGGAYLLGPDGAVMLSQSDDVKPGVRFADREYFIVPRDNPDIGLYFSHPYHSRLRGGKLTVGLSRRIDDIHGDFAGIALLAIRIEYFQRLVDRIDNGAQGAVFIAMDDGTLLARKPFVARDIGQSIGRSPIFAPMAAHAAGTYVAKSSVDGVRRIYTYARVPGTPLIVAVAPAVSDVLAPWWRRSRIAGALTLALGGVFVIVSWLHAFALRDKQRAQSALVHLAATDPLTGLSNRRVLDSRLEQEWRRGLRSGRPLSVLFIDIDHFKRFNDTYGHACGDEALTAVAECISAAVRRSVDVVARYGGEEFAVVLPDTTSDAAQAVAEKIRRKVQTENLVRSDGGKIVVTVSIGCATSVPAQGEHALDLLAAADQQLYAAKAAGRNRISSAQAPAAPAVSMARDSSV
jgi:diguanylate cyclase (GGDEF)-like protein